MNEKMNEFIGELLLIVYGQLLLWWVWTKDHEVLIYTNEGEVEVGRKYI